ncbi:hypothetical protein OWR29_47725 [Actinoplanes sp. Pm04-4]|uniref:Nucleoside 2-deoxyribosyltransferase n=1 Tax=Paractinoplanes pyxinae TaxID=2997416 RepID=A0ABT4BGS1_9ACTN|nr:hypothetical protein [Actinoplanes pyxinae]MCY1145736.1 hypothetical protein [Actinoplanes pyxinae]
MSVFVSGQIGEKARIREVFSDLVAEGWRITHDWTTTDDLGKVLESGDEASRRAAADITGVLDADVYLLVSDNKAAGKGMYVELGAALAMAESRGAPDVYIVGPMNHASIFYLHPLVRHLPDVAAVVKDVQDRRNLKAAES